MKEDKFWTYPAETPEGLPLIVTGRDDTDSFRESGKYVYRITVSMPYAPLPDGLPADTDAPLLEQATDAFLAETHRDKAAVLTGIYTGDSRRDWIFYTRSLHIFRNILNRALAPLPLLPLEISAEEDPAWEEYLDMRAHTYIPDAD
ncbi:MAG: DUF695 domain-containing protein [Bacteroides sp.]|nr:DUF695 domain-containing protein [Bacteroides sp.]